MFVKTSALVFVLLATGCSGMRFGMNAASPPVPDESNGATPKQAAEAPEPVRTAPPSQSTVAAIEEFLERTRGYARPVVQGDVQGQQPLATTTSERSTSETASLPVVERQPPNVDVRNVTAVQSETTPHAGYNWRMRHVAAAGPPVDPTPPGPATVRMAMPASTTYKPGLQPVPGLVADQAPTQAVAAMETQPRMPALPVLQSVSIGIPTELRSASAPDNGMSNVPVEVAAEPLRPTWHTLIEELSDQAKTRADVLAFWRLGLARLASDALETGPLNMPGLSDEASSLLDALFLAVASVRDQLVDPVSSGTRTLERVESLRRKIAETTDPIVSAVALCSRVTTFGVYEQMGPTDIVAGRPSQVIVYCELDNLHAKELDDGRFETNLATRVEVLTSDGRSVWTHEEPQIIDQCRRRRRDFFLAQRLTLPATLPAGEYVLKVMVEDSLSGRTNEAIEPFVISSALSLAERGRHDTP